MILFWNSKKNFLKKPCQGFHNLFYVIIASGILGEKNLNLAHYSSLREKVAGISKAVTLLRVSVLAFILNLGYYGCKSFNNAFPLDVGGSTLL